VAYYPLVFFLVFYLLNIKKDYTDLIIFLLFLYLSAIIGSYLLYILVNYKNVIFVFNNKKVFENNFSALRYIFGGSVFYGGLLGGIFTGYMLTRKYTVFKKYIDIVVVGIPLFHFFGRIGCFLGGCCYGISCKFGFVYTNSPITEANGVMRFPIQLFEAVFNIGLFFLLNHLLNNEKFKDKLLYVYLLIYATGRFFIEYLRGDIHRGVWFIFSTSQIISILIILTVLIKIILNKWKKEKYTVI